MQSSFEKEDALEAEPIEYYGKFISNKCDTKELELDIKVIFLSLCSPNLAPVKYFFRIIKIKMRKYHLNSNVNFNNLNEDEWFTILWLMLLWIPLRNYGLK